MQASSICVLHVSANVLVLQFGIAGSGFSQIPDGHKLLIAVQMAYISEGLKHFSCWSAGNKILCVRDWVGPIDLLPSCICRYHLKNEACLDRKCQLGTNIKYAGSQKSRHVHWPAIACVCVKQQAC